MSVRGEVGTDPVSCLLTSSSRNLLKPTSRLASKILGVVLLGPLLLLAVAWSFGALYFTFPVPALRVAAAWVFVAGSVLALILAKRKLRAVAGIFLGFIATLGWFLSISPSNDRDWPPELAVMPSAEIRTDRVTVHGIRNFDYRTPEEFDVRYYDKAFDLTKLQGVDVFYSYWEGNEAVAHTMFSWDFGGADVLCLSVEVRRCVGQTAGGLPGIYKQFEILYILADERDVVRLRTNYRGEEVYLIRTVLTPDEGRRLLLDVLEQVNRLREHPQFYRTVGNNCTTSIVGHVNAIWPGRIPFTKKILMNGFAPEIAYANHLHDTDLPFDEWKRSGHINDAARAADEDPLFSRRIREGRPQMDAAIEGKR
jgi:hypothetical protein